jgi:hypothetical protein
MMIDCPRCKSAFELNIGALMGAATSAAKRDAARANGRRGGRPRKLKTVRKSSRRRVTSA